MEIEDEISNNGQSASPPNNNGSNFKNRKNNVSLWSNVEYDQTIVLDIKKSSKKGVYKLCIPYKYIPTEDDEIFSLFQKSDFKGIVDKVLKFQISDQWKNNEELFIQILDLVC